MEDSIISAISKADCRLTNVDSQRICLSKTEQKSCPIQCCPIHAAGAPLQFVQCTRTHNRFRKKRGPFGRLSHRPGQRRDVHRPEVVRVAVIAQEVLDLQESVYTAER